MLLVKGLRAGRVPVAELLHVRRGDLGVGCQDEDVVSGLGNLRCRESVQRKMRTFGTHSTLRLYGIGPSARLLGTDVSEVADIPRSAVTLASSNFQNLGRVSLSEPDLPLYVTGVLDTARNEPVQLAIALNGVIVATTESYRQGGAWTFAAMVAEDGLLDGRNGVRLFTIGPGAGPTSLRPVAARQ